MIYSRTSFYHRTRMSSWFWGWISPSFCRHPRSPKQNLLLPMVRERFELCLSRLLPMILLFPWEFLCRPSLRVAQRLIQTRGKGRQIQSSTRSSSNVWCSSFHQRLPWHHPAFPTCLQLALLRRWFGLVFLSPDQQMDGRNLRQAYLHLQLLDWFSFSFL